MTENDLPVVRAFISYSHEDRKYGKQVKQVLAEVGIEAFLAHEDLEVSDEWQERILEELRCCDLFIPILSAKFVESPWALQEVGFIISRPKVVVAPLSIDETIPKGFISRVQSSRIPKEGITREILVEPLARRFPRAILPGLIRLVGSAGSFRAAETLMRPLVPLFPLFMANEAQALAEAAIKNGQIWSAAKCQGDYLPNFIQVQGANLKPKTLRALQYQIEHNGWYDPTKDKEA